jgi:hypothetical protein
MRKNPTTKARRIQTPRLLPPQLAALVSFVNEEIQEGTADEMARALKAARAAFREAQHRRNDIATDSIEAFVTGEAERGPWADLHQKIRALEGPEDSAFNAFSGDFMNVYGGPAFTFGIALAYVYLTDGGVR